MTPKSRVVLKALLRGEQTVAEIAGKYQKKNGCLLQEYVTSFLL